MGLTSKYTRAQIKSLSKKEIMKEASYDDILTNYGVNYNVVVLCRESTTHADQRKALEDQKDRMLTFLDKYPHLQLLEGGLFVEDGKSGLAVDLRPDFEKMIDKACKEGDIVLVQEASRFSRNIVDFFKYMQILQNNEVGLLIVEGEFWTYHMGAADWTRLAAEVSKGQAESMTTSQRVSRGIDTYRERGQLVQGDMFGYDLVKAVNRKDNTYKINPVAGATVKKIFELYVNEGLGTGTIATRLNKEGMMPFDKSSSWTASKVLRVLRNEKYMGYNLYGKSKTVDTNTKKRVLTGIEPVRETIYDKDGETIFQECNLVKGNWEPLVTEEMWWKANEIRKKRSSDFIHSNKGAIKNGLRASNDAYANKSYCECGYRLSPQYTHAATENEPAQFRYHCRQQVNYHSPKYRLEHGLPLLDNVCSLAAVSDVKMRLMSIKVFERIFEDANTTIDSTIKLLEAAEAQAEAGVGQDSAITLKDLEAERDRRQNRLNKLIDMRADGEITSEEYNRARERALKELSETKKLIDDRRLAESEREKFKMDINNIRQRLETYVDLRGYGVSDEMIEFFVERIIRRAGDVYVWEMNLSGLPNKANKYKIKGFDKGYSDSLKDDKNFNIIQTFVISLEECKEFCEKVAKRQFRPKYWRQITVKIAVK